MTFSKALPLICAIALIAAACTPKTAEQPTPAQTGSSPSESLKTAFPNCSWSDVTGAGLSMGAFTCADQKIVADEALPGFVLESIGADGKTSRTAVVQLFTKAADAPVESVLDAVRAASPGAFSAECVLTANTMDPTGKTFLFVPAGAGKAAYDAFRAGKSDEDSMPCGAMGPSEGGERLFTQVDGAPDKVALISIGSDIQIFDSNTLRAAN